MSFFKKWWHSDKPTSWPTTLDHGVFIRRPSPSKHGAGGQGAEFSGSVRKQKCPTFPFQFRVVWNAESEFPHIYCSHDIWADATLCKQSQNAVLCLFFFFSQLLQSCKPAAIIHRGWLTATVLNKTLTTVKPLTLMSRVLISRLNMRLVLITVYV